MIIFVRGEDVRRAERFVAEQITRFREKRDPAGYNTTILDAKDASEEALRSAVTASPFLADKRLVVIKNPLSASREMIRLVQDFAEKGVPATAVVIVWQVAALARFKEVQETAKLLGQGQYVYDFNPLVGLELERWVQEEIKRRGGTGIEPAALRDLMKAGMDVDFIDTALDQMIAHAGGAVIRPATVTLFITSAVNETVFQALDAWFAGNSSRALALLEARREAGDEDEQILGSIIWGVRTLLQIAGFLQKYPVSTSEDMARDLKINPFVVKKNRPIAERLGFSRCAAIVAEVAALDEAVKTGRITAGLAVDRLVAANPFK